MVRRKWKTAMFTLFIGVVLYLLEPRILKSARHSQLALDVSLDLSSKKDETPSGMIHRLDGVKTMSKVAINVQDGLEYSKDAPRMNEITDGKATHHADVSKPFVTDAIAKSAVYDNSSAGDVSSKKYSNDIKGKDVAWSPASDLLQESTVLKDAPLSDMREMVDVKQSTYHLIDPKASYSVGDEIKIGVQLNDGFGRRRTIGGDRLMVRIFENSLGAKANGYILDHMNGTYTAVVKCLWSGNPTIHIALDFPRQVICLFYNTLRTNFRTIFVFYSNSERQPCQPTRALLNTSKPICDMADRNGGMSWFCQAPESKEITCEDNIKIFNNNSDMNPVDKMPDASLMRIGRSHLPAVKISVQGQTTDPIKPAWKAPCISYNKTQLWFLPPPVGYFMHDEWKINHCTAPSQERHPDCLRNKHFIFFGDSTTRQWVAVLGRRYKLNSMTKPVFAEGVMFKSDTSSFSDTLNLTVDWVGHSLPGNRFRNFSTSIAKHIQLFKGKKNMVFVIHIYLHIITHHHSVWRDRLRHIRQSIELFLQSNPDAKFLIKGGNGAHTERLFRYAHYLYRVILIEEFKGLYDKVIYLDSADASTASGHDKVHPVSEHVSGMVDQMLAYICQ